MDRKDFFSVMGMSAAAFAIINCAACSKNGDASTTGVSGPSGVDFTLDLTASANAALLTNGGYLNSNGIIVARTTADIYIAVQQSCTHENYPLVYQGSNHRLYCNNHGSYFSEAGVVQVSPATRSLTTYTTVLTGNSLRIHS